MCVTCAVAYLRAFFTAGKMFVYGDYLRYGEIGNVGRYSSFGKENKQRETGVMFDESKYLVLRRICFLVESHI